METDITPNQSPAPDSPAVADCPAPICSPFDALMGQIEAMRDRARQYAEESEAEQNYEEGHRHRSVEGTLNELHRLGQFFKENTKPMEG